MCRKNLIPAAALLGFGAGVILSLLWDSSLVRLVLGAAALAIGCWLLRGRC